MVSEKIQKAKRYVVDHAPELVTATASTLILCYLIKRDRDGVYMHRAWANMVEQGYDHAYTPGIGLRLLTPTVPVIE